MKIILRVQFGDRGKTIKLFVELSFVLGFTWAIQTDLPKIMGRGTLKHFRAFSETLSVRKTHPKKSPKYFWARNEKRTPTYSLGAPLLGYPMYTYNRLYINVYKMQQLALL